MYRILSYINTHKNTNNKILNKIKHSRECAIL